MDILQITCEDPTGSGMVLEHNMPCAVCGTNHAVAFTNNGTFTPCWKCQKEGWDLVKRPNQRNFWQKVLGYMFTDHYEFTFVIRERFAFRKNTRI